MLRTPSGTESHCTERQTDGGIASAPGIESVPSRASHLARAVIPYAVIVLIITTTTFPMLRSGERINRNIDFYQYAARHEAVRISLLEHYSMPLRSHWLGGGYPTIADPEDPTFNPLIVFSVVFGTVQGLKLIGYVALLIAGLSTYAFTHSILRYTRWGALYSGLVYGTSLFVPLRLLNGNINEVYAAFLPLCLLLLGLACWGRRIAIIVLPFVFYTMLSDGKTHSLMAMFYVGVVCLFATIPPARLFSPCSEGVRRSPLNYRPLKFFVLVIGLTALIGMMRILPAEELIRKHGGIQRMLTSHPRQYLLEGIPAYTVERLWNEAVSVDGRVGMVTVGWIPLCLSGIAFIAFWRHTVAWGLSLLLFVWLALAHRAPIDLFALLWKLPVFEAIYQPDKYFSFQIVFTIAIVSGQSFSLLQKLRVRWMQPLIAIIVIVCSVGFLYPKARSIHGRTFTREVPGDDLWTEQGFFHIEGMSLLRHRRTPPRSLAYFNLRQNIGTVDWYTAIPIREDAVAKYFVGRENDYTFNPAYRGEVFFDDPVSAGSVSSPPVIRSNTIDVSVEVRAPAVLIINQNFHRDWHVNHGKLFSRGGRLAVQLEETGQYVVHLRYHPRRFYVGLAITTSTLLGIGWVCWTSHTGRLNRWSQHGPCKRWSQAILFLIK